MNKVSKFFFWQSQLIAIAVFCCVIASSCKKSKDEPAPKTEVDPGANPGDLGKVEFVYRGKTVVYTTVRGKDGNIWFQQNLGGSKVAATKTDTASYGDFFQWGRWDDGHQVRNPAPATSTGLTINNPSGIKSPVNKTYYTNWWESGSASDEWTAKTPTEASATNGCDPCRIIGGAWRLPTDTEWTDLANAENITNSETAFASNLKIPVAGWRTIASSAVIAGQGNESWFWSNTTAGGRGRGIWILSGSILKSYPDSRAFGTSIRCINKN